MDRCLQALVKNALEPSWEARFEGISYGFRPGRSAHDAIENLPEKWVEIKVTSVGAFVEIAVTDSGRGISKEIRDKIMEPFFTTKEPGKGTGLGLSITQGIVESHHGKFILDSKSKHTKFILRLPKTQNSIQQKTPLKRAA